VAKSNQQRNGEYGMSETAKTLAQELGIDRDALRERYQSERDKRIRPEHRNQYAEVKGALTVLNQDPYAPVAVERDARHEEADVVIIGGGFGGLLAAVRLASGRGERHSHHRVRFGFRRDLVLESIPRCAV
jgi:threonine dehydrogenase-like Zn-dependent dehydrogenase